MKKELFLMLALVGLGVGSAMAAGPKDDVFKGKLFAPNVILEHQAELDLSKAQFTAIRAAVVEVQAGVAEHEWDMREAYQSLMQELGKAPIDEERVLEYANVALLAENQVKKKQMAMLIRLKNLLTAEQVSFLETVQAK
ncbi:MAG: hypothetical protein KJO95_05395 [Gammaproteobacteria bacterium]|nr:hypothetical protein [Gammaproteobacteria bacterium]MBU2676846.1 hypothetical protein [Gammaproteobacteria bacterium]NNC58246.1 hypothetical protein [Woeseiaceae bacterium]NNL50580.1 hypothetical protein [Woeseiaceae bacterium]